MNFAIENIPEQLLPISPEALFHAGTGTVIEFHYDKRVKKHIDTGYDIGEVVQHQGIDKKIKFWGKDNLLPQYRDALLMSSNIVGELISSKRDLLIGQGLQAYRESYNEKGEKERKFEPLKPEIAAWIRKSKWAKRYLQNGVLNYYKHANVFVEFMKAKDGTILYMKSYDCKYVRPAEKVNGVVPGYYICADWDLPIDKDKNPVRYIAALPDYDDVKELPTQFMMHFGDEVFHDGYLYHPAYWGGEEWIDMANNIPVFHKNNVKNGYTPRFHIKIPRNYFLDKTAFSRATTDEDRNKCTSDATTAQQAFLDKMNDYLAGMENSGRAVYTIEDFDQITKLYHGIKIEAIDYDMKDEALLKLFEASNQANISAQGFPPILAGIENSGKLSSGSEVRNLLMYFIISKLPRRRADILEPFELMLEINGWYDTEIKYTFEDILITKLDENKSGVQTQADNTNEIPK